VQIHLYADDTQLYLPFQPDQSEDAMKRLNACVEDIPQWMEKNFLKLNDTKTEFIIFGTPKNVGKVVEWTVDVGDAIILPSASVRNIGAMLNPTFNMETHIIGMKRACYLQLRSLSRIRKYLTQEAAEKLTHAFVTSRLDNLNSLLINTPSFQVHQLQLIQNTAARIVTQESKFCHITPILKELHWLPVEARIEFKTLLQVYKCVNGTAPGYLSSLVDFYSCPREGLRSAKDTFKLKIPSSKLQKFGDRAFSVAGPRIWNDLPRHIRESPSVASFKQAVKTHLFKRVYPT